ncbi:hypothetical protein IAT40_005023 [Kwoniella sp. CBS 6097]
MRHRYAFPSCDGTEDDRVLDRTAPTSGSSICRYQIDHGSNPYAPHHIEGSHAADQPDRPRGTKIFTDGGATSSPAHSIYDRELDSDPGVATVLSFVGAAIFAAVSANVLSRSHCNQSALSDTGLEPAMRTLVPESTELPSEHPPLTTITSTLSEHIYTPSESENIYDSVVRQATNIIEVSISAPTAEDESDPGKRPKYCPSA